MLTSIIAATSKTDPRSVRPHYILSQAVAPLRRQSNNDYGGYEADVSHRWRITHFRSRPATWDLLLTAGPWGGINRIVI